MTRYRAARIVVIVTAALVPVLAAVGGVPRWALGLLGATAAIMEGLQGLFQFRRSALDAMKTCNELERTLNKHITAIDPYQGSPDTAFPLFVAEIEAIRKAADDAFLQPGKLLLCLNHHWIANVQFLQRTVRKSTRANQPTESIQERSLPTT